MGQKYPHLTDDHQTFIAAQKIFFVGTATADSRVNVSPKGMDTFRVLSPNRVAWLNVTGSGNETAAHVQIDPRMTIMFTALEGKPMIMRLYGTATAVHRSDAAWDELSGLFEPIPGARQVFDMTIDLVQTSCGMAVPYYDYAGERGQLNAWAVKKGDEGIEKYWREKNEASLDGQPTHIVVKNLGE